MRTCRIDRCKPRYAGTKFTNREPGVAGKTFPAFPAHAQPAFLRILQEARGTLSQWQHLRCCPTFGQWFAADIVAWLVPLVDVEGPDPFPGVISQPSLRPVHLTLYGVIGHRHWIVMATHRDLLVNSRRHINLKYSTVVLYTQVQKTCWN